MTGQSKRKEYRGYSKATLLKALELLFAQRDETAAIEAKRWRRRLYAVACSAFAAGAVVGGGTVYLLL